MSTGQAKYWVTAMAALLIAACGGGDDNTALQLPSYAIGGTVSGLSGSVVLQNNGSDDIVISTDGPFTFAAKLSSGATYQVSVLTQPDGQTCTVNNASGTVSGAKVTNVAVTCATLTYQVGGTLTGLAAGKSVVLQVNGTDSLGLTENGAFLFPTPLAVGANYVVTVHTHPVDYSCSIANGTGTITTADVSDVTISCVIDSYTVGGSTGGLDGTVTLQNNGVDNLDVSVNGPFTFPTAVPTGANYLVTVLTQPSGQSCDVGNGSGTITGANVTDVSVACAPLCGNGALDSAEVCDDGNSVSETTCPYGTPTCTACDASCGQLLPLTGNYCGDNLVGGPEVCDDGNIVTETSCPYGVASCMSCNSTCSAALNLTGQYCGNGVTTDMEVCDDGNTITESACPYGTPSCFICVSTCDAEMNVTGPYCGDNVISHGEVCDDGNNVNSDGCNSACTGP